MWCGLFSGLASISEGSTCTAHAPAVQPESDAMVGGVERLPGVTLQMHRGPSSTSQVAPTPSGWGYCSLGLGLNGVPQKSHPPTPGTCSLIWKCGLYRRKELRIMRSSWILCSNRCPWKRRGHGHTGGGRPPIWESEGCSREARDQGPPGTGRGQRPDGPTSQSLQRGSLALPTAPSQPPARARGNIGLRLSPQHVVRSHSSHEKPAPSPVSPLRPGRGGWDTKQPRTKRSLEPRGTS